MQMPLHDFPCGEDNDFFFNHVPYSIQELGRRKIPDLPGLSEMDRAHISREKWWLVAEDPRTNFRTETNLMLICMRILKRRAPFIKFRICEQDERHCGKLNETMGPVSKSDASVISGDGLFTAQDLRWVDQATARMVQMDKVSNRTHNAIYFLFRGCYLRMWVDTFMLWMASLESLFSRDQGGSATRTICSRASNFLEVESGATYDDVKYLYDIRSQMVHGRLPLTEDRAGERANIDKLAHLERILLDCFRKFLDEEAYVHFSDPENREGFLSTLDA